MTITSTFTNANVEIRPAPDALAKFSGCFWIIEATEGSRIDLVPDGYSSIWCELRGRRSDWFFRGALESPGIRRFRSRTTLVGVRLRPGVTALLGSKPLVGERIRLTRVAWARQLVDARSNDSSPTSCLARLERFLVAKLASTTMHPVIVATLDAIQRSNGRASLDEIAAACRVSPRHVERLMRSWTGFGPKAFARVVRFQSTLAQMADAPKDSLASVAASNGYFDQAHLNGDATRFAALTPGRIARRSMSEFSKTRCT